MKKLVIGLMLGAASLIGVSQAQASIAYDTSLNTAPIGGFTSNTHWTVDSEAGGLQLGLQGTARYLGGYAPNPGTSTYIIQQGTFQPPSSHTGSLWDFAYSLDLGSTGLTLADVTSSLCMTDLVQGTSGCFDPLRDDPLLDDNRPGGTDLSGTVAQNAETLSFGHIALDFSDPGFNPNIANTYSFTWTLSNGAVQLAQVGATLKAVPEPSTIALFVTALAGLGFFAWKRRRATGAV